LRHEQGKRSDRADCQNQSKNTDARKKTPHGRLPPGFRRLIVNRHANVLGERTLQVCPLGDEPEPGGVGCEPTGGRLESGFHCLANVGVLGRFEIEPTRSSPATGLGGQDAIVIRPIMHIALSYDHRAVDGAPANGFLFRVKQLLEEAEFDL